MDATSTAILIALIGIVLKDFLLSPKSEMKDLRNEIKGLTVAVAKLESTISHQQEKIDKIPKIEKDINEAHRKLRESQ